MSSQGEKQKIAREALKILRVDISKEANPVEALRNVRFLMMSGIELDIWKTTQQILECLSQNKTKLTSSLLEKLKELVQESDWE
jgi:hypothetical protein